MAPSDSFLAILLPQTAFFTHFTPLGLGQFILTILPLRHFSKSLTPLDTFS